MKIRRIILISFFLLLSLIALPLMAVLFFTARESIEYEIGRNLNSEATMLMEEVDMLMFEHMQNVHSWSRLDIIQEARIGDIDKRLSQFLSDVESGYKGMYLKLFYTDAKQRIIAANTAKIIGQLHQSLGKEVKVQVPNGEVFIENQLPRLPVGDENNLLIRTPVYDRYSTEMIGQFYGLLDMQQLLRLLDKADSSGDRYIVLLDGEGQTIAASAKLRESGVSLTNRFSDWKPTNKSALFVHDGEPFTHSSVLVGYANSAGYHGYVQMGWAVLVFQNLGKAFLPIHSLLMLFILVIVVTMLMALLASHWISGRIAEPLLALTQWIRKAQNLEKSPPPEVVGGAIEIQELERTFNEVFQELARSREHVIQTAKLAIVGEMSAIMAHEIRTPLGIISTSAQWLQREQGLSPEGQEMSQFILEESARLRKLVTTLLECARPREPRILPQNIHDLLTHIVELLALQADKKQLQIKLQLAALNPVIPCDVELLTQAFLNLLLNAIQIVSQNGLIQIKTTMQAKHIRIDIADNGPGIAVTDYPRLFDPFFSKREGGIGLGLTVTRQIVLAHHGELSVGESEWGGACFTLQLPISKE